MNATENQTIAEDFLQETADTIRQQITGGVLMSLGARNFRAATIANAEGFAQPGFVFDATILPMTKAGRRGTAPRTMTVTASLNAADYYDVKVTYPQRGDTYGLKAPVTHYEADDVDAFSLARLMLSLDYDGDTVTNPRYA